MSPKVRDLGLCLAAGCLFRALAASWAVYRYGSLASAVQVWQGHSADTDFVVTTPNLILGRVEPLSSIYAPFAVTNRTGQPVSIVGDRIDCNCVNCDTNWPVRVPAGATIQFSYRMKAPAEGEKFSHLQTR